MWYLHNKNPNLSMSHTHLASLRFIEVQFFFDWKSRLCQQNGKTYSEISENLR